MEHGSVSMKVLALLMKLKPIQMFGMMQYAALRSRKIVLNLFYLQILHLYLQMI